MVCCFAFGCYCHDSYGKCSFFRFPANKTVFKKWENLCRRKDRSAKPSDRLCSCHFKDGKKENGASIFSWNKDKRFDFPEAGTKRPRCRRTPVSCVASGCISTVDARHLKNSPVHPQPNGRSGTRLSQWPSNAPSRSTSDVVNKMTLFRMGRVSRSVIKRPRSSSPPEFRSEREKRLLREKHRTHGFVVCTLPPSGDHNYGLTEVQVPWHSPVGRRKSRSPVLSSKKMRASAKVDDEAERLKIVEGANALLNLAGITLEPSSSMTFVMVSRSTSPVSMPVTTKLKLEVKSET